MHQLPSTDIPATLQGRNATDDGRQLPRFAPLQTVRCIGGRRFRTQSVRDAGCLFDIDLSVLSWTCCPSPLSYRGSAFVPDFEVVCDTSVEFVAVLEDGERVPDWAIAVAATRGTPILSVPTSELAGVRLENARELLRYANWRVTLSDRVRLLAALDQEGTLPLAEAMTTVRNGTDPIAAIATLALRRFVDLDFGRIGPETRFARWRNLPRPSSLPLPSITRRALATREGEPVS
jgi:hypothetical protein